MHKNIIIFILGMLLSSSLSVMAQEAQKSDLQKRAEAVDPSKNIAAARSLYIHAFNDYYNRGLMQQGVECAVKATALYYKENFWKEAFDLLHRADDAITSSKMSAQEKSSCRYLVAKERFQMYMKMHRSEGAKEHLSAMESHAAASGSDDLKNDVLYTKALYYYSFGMTAQGNAVFKEMADKLTASKQYDKVEEVYKTLIANGRRSNSASLVAQSYSSYMAWKDSATALKHADEVGALKKQIADNEATIADKDSSLSTRQAVIVGLGILAAALAAALVLGGLVLLRYIIQNRRLNKNLRLSNESNALKAKFISNISSQLDPTLKRLDDRQPEVRALLDFSQHIQTLSLLENSTDDVVLEEVQLQPFCEDIAQQVRSMVKPGVSLTVNAPRMSANINREYVSSILLHLLSNAAAYTTSGNIWLDFKKRGAHKGQFLVSDTGCGIAEEQRDNLFKPFAEIHDLTKGDGLGLPICKQMALKMKGDLDLDTTFTKGTRFTLDLPV